jgi:hypothetical protein
MIAPERTYDFFRGLTLFVILLLLSTSALAASPPKVVVGVLPTYNQGGSNYGPEFCQHLTTMIYQELQSSSVQPFLLNPGGLYTATADEYTLDYARKSDVDVALVTVLLTTEMPAKGDFTIKVKADLVDLKNGASMASWQSTTPINRHEVAHEAFATVGDNNSRVGQLRDQMSLFRSSEKPFEKQALGGAARKIAQDVNSQVVRGVASVTPAREAQPVASGGGACNINFKVGYVTKHASSKSYDLIVNGKNETLDIKDGEVPLSVPSGPLLIQLAVHDAPYKVPKQDLYQLSAQLDCSQNHHDLRYEIGQVGEGFVKWQ